jgi:ubiquinone biosynthesis protein UbiJ
MSLEKTMNELERYIDYAASYFADVKSELEDLEGKYMNEITDYIDQIDTLNEQNELLEEQVEDLNRKNAIFELENIELRLRIEVYELEI